MKRAKSAAALALLASVGGVAFAQSVITTSSGHQWEGFYAGVNAGGAWNTTCNTWDAQTNSAVINNALNNRDCPNGGVFVGGVQFGYNFQSENIVWGLGVDWDGASSKSRNRSLTYNGQLGTPPPTGTYNAYGKVEPSSFFLLGPRIAYAYNDWLPYFRVGLGHAELYAEWTKPRSRRRPYIRRVKKRQEQRLDDRSRCRVGLPGPVVR